MLRNKIGLFLRKIGLKKIPMEKVVKELKNREIVLSDLVGIELFSRDGGWSTDFIAKEIKSIDLCELSSEYEEILKKKYPKANIYMDNTYEFIKNHSKRYDLILSDNPASKHGCYFQNFSLFPSIFNLCKKETIFILNIIPDYSVIHYNENIEEEHQALKNFYQTDTIKVSTKRIVATYSKIAMENGYIINDSFNLKRNTGVEYLCLFLKKIND